MEQYEAFLRRLETSIKPRHEVMERSRTFTFEFARMALRSMFLLNGGALIALPAFAEMLGGIKRFQQNRGLRVDGVMEPDGPTLRHLGSILNANTR